MGKFLGKVHEGRYHPWTMACRCLLQGDMTQSGRSTGCSSSVSDAPLIYQNVQRIQCIRQCMRQCILSRTQCMRQCIHCRTRNELGSAVQLKCVYSTGYLVCEL